MIFPLYLRGAIADHEEQERCLMASELSWTVVRPPHLTDGPRTGRYWVGDATRSIAGVPMTLKISRADVADLMLQVLEREEGVRRALAVSYLRETAVAA